MSKSVELAEDVHGEGINPITGFKMYGVRMESINDYQRKKTGAVKVGFTHPDYKEDEDEVIMSRFLNPKVR